jgi:para-nitrobenzyl esterase
MRWLALITGVVLVVSGLYLRWQDAAAASLLRWSPDPQTLRRHGAGPGFRRLQRPPAPRPGWAFPTPQAPVGDAALASRRAAAAWVSPRAELQLRRRSARSLPAAFPPPSAEPGTLIGAEDCLTLNVFAPSGSARAPRCR